MEKEFVPYELAVKLKALGFDEPCFGYYENQDENLVINFNNLPLTENQKKRSGLYITDNRNSVLPQWATSAPTFSQAFRWFRKKHGLLGVPTYSQYTLISKKWTTQPLYGNYNSYEEAELACLDKLIEIVESKSE